MRSAVLSVACDEVVLGDGTTGTALPMPGDRFHLAVEEFAASPESPTCLTTVRLV